MSTDPIKTEGRASVADIPALASLPPYTAGQTLGVFDCGYGLWQMLLECACPADAEDYIARLQQEGFRLLSSNRKRDNLFWQMGRDRTVLTLSYVPSLSTLRLVPQDENDAVISGVKDHDFASVCTSQVTQIGLGIPREMAPADLADPPTGISISNVIRLCDGSFIVYDGGMPWDEYARRLYTVLRSQTLPGQPIVIAAWVLTHAHIDHTGVFDRFADEYADKVKVENIVLNFGRALEPESEEYQPHLLRQCDKFPGARVLRVLSGTDLYFRNAKLEVLFDQTLNHPRIIPNLNAETLVTRLVLDGVSYLFLADHADYEGGGNYPPTNFNNGAIRRMYGDYLKSDVVQVAHHGLGGGGTTALYELVGAKYALWPIGEEKYNRHNLGQSGANTYFLREDVKTFRSFDRLHILYTEDGSIRWKEYGSFADYEAEQQASDR